MVKLLGETSSFCTHTHTLSTEKSVTANYCRKKLEYNPVS